MTRVWLTRGGAEGQFEDFALREGRTGGGWSEVPNLAECTTYEDVRKIMAIVRPDHSARAVGNWAGQLWSLRFQIAIGDFVVMPRKGQGLVALGVVTSEYMYAENATPGQRHFHCVDWKVTDIPKTSLGADIRRSLGTFMTIGEIRRENIVSRIEATIANGVDPLLDDANSQEQEESPNDNSVAPNVAVDAEVSVQELIRVRFPDHDLAVLVEAVLQARGYMTRLSPKGPDGGVDVLAGRGDLGFESPRIAVQVKNSISAQGISQLNELVGAKETFGADQALFVSWGGFTNDARRMARNEWFQLRLWDADDLVREVTDVYLQLDAGMQTKIPLREVWVAVVQDDNP